MYPLKQTIKEIKIMTKTEIIAELSKHTIMGEGKIIIKDD